MELKLQSEDAHKVLTDPDVFSTIAEDGMYYVEHDPSALYLCGYVPELIGCFIIHKQNRVTVECHVQVLPKYREQYALEFGHAFMAWTWANINCEKIVAQIPCIYPNVKDFALKLGFEIEGINRASYMKNDEIHDQWHLGVIR